MRDISKKLSIINTGERKKTSESSVTTQYISGGGGSIGGGNFLPKPTWDKVFEIKTTENGEEYLFGKLNLVLQYGLTAFADVDNLDLPDIYDGLKIDNQTIYWEEVKEEVTDENGNVVEKITKVLKAKGGSGEGTIKDVTVNGDGNALTSVSLSGDKKSLVFGKDKTFAEKTYVDQNFVTLATSQTITGSKNFTGGLSVNGCELVYNSYYGYWKLTGDLLVTGGIATFSSDTAFSPTSIMDGIVCDNKTIKKNSYNQLEVIGGAGVTVKIVSKGDSMNESNVLYVVV